MHRYLDRRKLLHAEQCARHAQAKTCVRQTSDCRPGSNVQHAYALLKMLQGVHSGANKQLLIDDKKEALLESLPH